MENGKLLNHQEWLYNIGFVTSPFEQDDFRAETDRWLKLQDFSAYWDWDNISSLTGTFDFPGYRFIFSSEGGGKSSIGKRIHLMYEGVSLLNTEPRALVLDYPDHTYPNNEISLRHHVRRIIEQAELKIGNSFSREKKLIHQSPYQALKKLISRVQDELAYSGVFVLVDNVDALALHKIKSLAVAAQLRNLKGFVIKFFLPQKLLFLAYSEFSLEKSSFYSLKWTHTELLPTLNQRLITCLHPDLRDQITQPISLLSKNEKITSIVDSFIKLGELANSPRIMWQFGDYLVEEHIAHSNLGIKATDLIGYQALSRAYLRLLNHLQKTNMVIRPDENVFDQSLVIQSGLRSRYSVGDRLKIFLCYEKRYEKEIEDDLYLKLDSMNYEPWMFSKDILPGQTRDMEIKKAVRESDVFLLCLSSTSSNEEGDFHRGFREAISKQDGLSTSRTFIIPLRLDDTEIPDDYRDLNRQSIEWFREDQKIKLFHALEKIRKTKEEKSS
jgi:hypothetical protein